MGYRPRYKLAFRPPDPPGQSVDSLNRLIKEANKTIEEARKSMELDLNPMFITGSVSVEQIQKSYLTAGEMRKEIGLPDPYRMESAIPPMSEVFDTAKLYHPSTYAISGVSYVAADPKPLPPRRPPPTSVPSAGRSLIGSEPLKPIRETVLDREMERVRRAREKDFWREWKFLWSKLAAWWARDFGHSSRPTPPHQPQVLPGGTAPLQSGQVGSGSLSGSSPGL